MSSNVCLAANETKIIDTHMLQVGKQWRNSVVSPFEYKKWFCCWKVRRNTLENKWKITFIYDPNNFDRFKKPKKKMIYRQKNHLKTTTINQRTYASLTLKNSQNFHEAWWWLRWVSLHPLHHRVELLHQRSIQGNVIIE